jgi:hypothetical protein
MILKKNKTTPENSSECSSKIPYPSTVNALHERKKEITSIKHLNISQSREPTLIGALFWQISN